MQHALKPQHRIFSAVANIISIWTVILYFVSYLTWDMVTCQNKDCCCSACTELHQAEATPWSHHRNVILLLQPGRKTPDSTNDRVNWFCLGSIIALRQQTARRYPGQIAGPNPQSRQFQAQLATLLMQTHGWKESEDLCIASPLPCGG